METLNLAIEQGCARPNEIEIPLKKEGRSYDEIYEDVTKELNSSGYVWFKDYFMYYRDREGKEFVVIEIHNKDLAKHIPQTIIGDLI